MLIQELGVVTTLLIGIAIGFTGFVILNFWIKLFLKNFSSETKIFWIIFWLHQIIWTTVVCVLPYEWLNDNFKIWSLPFMIYFFGSLLVIGFIEILKKR